MSSGPNLECGHGQCDTRPDCLACLQFTVQMLNERLKNQQIATLDCQADLRDARTTIELGTELLKRVDEYQKWCEYLLDNDFANEGDRQFAWEQFGAAKDTLERCIQRETQRVLNADANDGEI